MSTSGPLHEATDAETREAFSRLDFVTSSDEMIPLLRQASKAASASDVTVLLEGETGTGKGVLARAIHQLDQKRRGFPFVTVNCCAVAEALAESELFGHHRGAFTGAVSDRHGLFHRADHGTLFLDDINDLPLEMQPKLLDVIQRGVVRPMGADQEMRLDVRIIAASNQPLRELVLQKRFRADLYYRLNVIKMRLPSLRERPNDLTALLLAISCRHSGLYSMPIRTVDADLIAFLQTRPLCGNVRELENAVQRILLGKRQGLSLSLEEWQANATEDGAEDQEDALSVAAQYVWEAISHRGMPLAQAFRQIERFVIHKALNTGGSTRGEVARRLSTSERTLYHKMRQHHLGHHAEAEAAHPQFGLRTSR
jgi:transcriptional regulator with PAS, ATPase and Fis domain